MTTSSGDGQPLPNIPVAPSIPAFDVPPPGAALIDRRVLYISALSIGIAILAAFIAKGLSALITALSLVAFLGHMPADNHLGWWVVIVPVIGGLIVGLMARYGSTGIRGHGIPEAMERVLQHDSRIPARLTFLKPLSAAVAIGTGGPFGAEGPIIATGGALGSVIGQLLHTSAQERKTLLAAGAAAGMAATFGTPVSAVLLAIELLLFEFRPRSFIPVALAGSVAVCVRFLLHMPYPMFHLPEIHAAGPGPLAVYLLVGAIIGAAAALITRLVYWIEDMFEHLHIHWMWWPAVGAVVVGIVGKFSPRTLGVGYDNISDMLSLQFTVRAALILGTLKLLSWSVALGSGTSGGTLAPLFTIGSAMGFILGMIFQRLLPGVGIEPQVAALVGMAAIFAGASRALLTSAVFAFETTLQPLGLPPLLGGCAAAYAVSCLMMPNTIMTEKIARRGVRAPVEYEPDPLSRITVREAASLAPIVLRHDEIVGDVRIRLLDGQPDWQHQGFPVVDSAGSLIGVVTRRDLIGPQIPTDRQIGQLIHRPPAVIYEDLSLRDATDQMVRHNIGRLPVVRRTDRKLIGIITRSDLLQAHRRLLNESVSSPPTLGPLRRPNVGEPVKSPVQTK